MTAKLSPTKDEILTSLANEVRTSIAQTVAIVDAAIARIDARAAAAVEREAEVRRAAENEFKELSATLRHHLRSHSG